MPTESRMQPCEVSGYTLTSAVGCGLALMRDSLNGRQSGLRRNDFPHCDLDTWIGRVAELDAAGEETLEPEWRSRNNALAALGLAQDGFLDQVALLRGRFGPSRIGTIIGTSTSSIGRTEQAYRQLSDDRMPPEFWQPRVHQPHSPSLFVAEACGLTGPALSISTACASGTRVFSSAQRWLQAGLVDAVVVGGVDTLCLSVLYGFNSLQLTSTERCKPFDRERNGINIGEAAGYALLTRPGEGPPGTLNFLGYGESSDAWHMSHPHPDGDGAVASMSGALRRAGITAAEVDYVNLHGTATPANDAAEALAMSRVFEGEVFASSTKGWTGHALGAAGIVETVIAMDSLVTGLVPGTLNLTREDPDLAFVVQQHNQVSEVRHVLTNSFGFGGNNCSLVFGKGY